MEQKNSFEDNRHIVTLTVSELQMAIKKVVRREIENLRDDIQDDSAEAESKQALLTRMEVAKLFRVSTVSLDKWRRAGILPKPIKMANKIYFIKEEISQLIKKRKIK